MSSPRRSRRHTRPCGSDTGGGRREDRQSRREQESRHEGRRRRREEEEETQGRKRRREREREREEGTSGGRGKRRRGGEATEEHSGAVESARGLPSSRDRPLSGHAPRDYYQWREHRVLCSTEKLLQLHDTFEKTLLSSFLHEPPSLCEPADPEPADPEPANLEPTHESALLHPALSHNLPSGPRPPPDDSALLEDGHSLLPELWHCYSLSISPDTNFKTSFLLSGGRQYHFKGFSLLSCSPLENIPPCLLKRYGGHYSVQLTASTCPQNFVPRDLRLFQDYLFVGLLELYDWATVLAANRKKMMFFPQFVRDIEGGGGELLSGAQLLQSLLDAHKPIVSMATEDQRDVSCKVFGLLASHPNKRPHCVRVDRLEWPEEEGAGPGAEGAGPNIVHINREHDGQRGARDSHRDSVLLLPCTGVFSTGLHSDTAQYALLLPVLLEHVLFHLSLGPLEDRLGYCFSDKQLLERALTHPSFSLAFGTTEEHVKTSLCNCSARRLTQLPASPAPPTELSSLLLAASAGGGERGRSDVPMHYEQLEFLGDAVLEYLCSLHLFHLLPSSSDGDLTGYRRVLVKNTHLASIAARLSLNQYLRVGDVTFDPSRTVANCVEAILAAVFLDSGLGAAQSVLARMLFPEEDLQGVWLRYPPHPLQLEHPEGDRHLVANSDVLKHLVSLEESVGVQFTHIRLLAKAFAHPSLHYDNLTKGSYQRMEFLGDAVLQFLSSLHVYQCLPSHREGTLSVLRTSLVHNKQLAALSTELGLHQFVQTSKTEGVSLTSKILADVFESFLASLVLDKGLHFAQRFLQVSLFPKLTGIESCSQLLDPSTKLVQAAAQACKRDGESTSLPVYKTLKREGPSNKPVFTVGVYFRDQRIGTGIGSSLREARFRAAQSALDKGALPHKKPHFKSDYS